MSRRYTFAVATVLTSLIVGMLFAQWWNLFIVAGERVGIGISEVEGAIEISGVSEGDPADLAGVIAGDLLVAVNGHPVNDFESLGETDPMWRRGVPLELTILRAGRLIELTVVPGASLPWFDLAVTAVSCLAYLALGLIAFGQSPDDLRIRLLFLYSVAVALEFALPGEISLLPWWTGFQFVVFDLLTGLEVGLLLHLASVIPQPARWFTSSRWLPAGYYVIGAAIAGVTALSTILTELEARAPVFLDDIGVVFINSWVLPIWSATVAGILAHQVVSAPTKRARSQAILIFLGILPWMGYQVVYQYVVPMGDAAPGWLAGLQTVVLLIFPLTVFIAIFKFHLLDIEFVLRRGLAFVLVTAAMVALFGTVFGLGTVFFGSMSDPTGSSVAALSVGMLALGLLFAPVRAGVQRLVDRRFFPESLKMTELLSELAAELPSLGSLPAMARHLVAEVDRVFGVSNATLLVADPDSGMMISLASSAVDLDHRFGQTLLIEPDDPGLRLLERGGRPLPADQVAGASSALARRLHAFDAELVVGLTSREALVGVLLLGPKVGGERFRSSEIEMLNLFSHAAATVVENVRLFESATYESLTGLLRRETIIDKLVAELQRSTRYGRPLSVGMVDIDHFKRINDSYGHLAGDALLKHVARELDNGLRTTDSIGRYGGEEFLFVLPETDLESARVVAEKLRSAIDDMESPLDDEPNARVTVSIGLAAVDHDDREEMTVERLILLADQALLEAKRMGRNRVICGPGAAA